MQIPSLDLRDYLSTNPKKQQQFITQLGDALKEVGFFSLSSWTTSPSLIDDAYASAKEFFALSEQQKQHYSYPQLSGQVGFVGLGKEKAKDAQAYDLKEFWHVSREAIHSNQNPMPYGKHYDLWCKEVAEMQPSLTALYHQLEKCAVWLLEACALYLELQKDIFVKMIQNGPTLLRVVHYPALSLQEHPQGAIRAAAHEDINLITLLCASTAQGLEIRDRKGAWHNVDMKDPRELIVDSGDMLQNITNGILASTTHRVVNPSGKAEARYSMPCFIHPTANVDLTPLPECIKRSGGKAYYPSITAGTYLQQRLKEIGLLS
ncbi:MAG: isopenicillin N synthase family oxygenase [Proteobacteria bacterium]|nr:isopenicillin N synthase family oxygenase [Pseudomonadota bacterium]